MSVAVGTANVGLTIEAKVKATLIEFRKARKARGLVPPIDG